MGKSTTAKSEIRDPEVVQRRPYPGLLVDRAITEAVFVGILEIVTPALPPNRQASVRGSTRFMCSCLVRCPDRHVRKLLRAYDEG